MYQIVDVNNNTKMATYDQYTTNDILNTITNEKLKKEVSQIILGKHLVFNKKTYTPNNFDDIILDSDLNDDWVPKTEYFNVVSLDSSERQTDKKEKENSSKNFNTMYKKIKRLQCQINDTK